VQRAEARMHHDQHPGKADSDGNQAVPPDPFVQQGTGKRRHEERGKEENGDGLVELKIFQCDEIERRRADHDSGANHLHGALRRA